MTMVMRLIFGYDGNRNLLTITDDLNNITTNTYDARGRLDTITDAENNMTAFEYDGSGNRTKETDAEGTVSDYTSTQMEMS